MVEERLQKILSERGVASRRKAEELIAAGKVKVNGRPASLGDKADPRRDTITVQGKKLTAAPETVYIMLHKPRGYVTTLNDEQGRRCVADLVKDVGTRVYPIGRLDRDSEGLLFLTNDGEFANAMMHPSGHISKRYRVTVHADVTDEQMETMAKGIVLDGRKTAPAQVEAVQREEGRTVLEIVLQEGRNRQIRRRCEAVGLEVVRLRRTTIGNVKLGMLPAGKWRALSGREMKSLLLAANVPGRMKAASDYIRRNG